MIYHGSEYASVSEYEFLNPYQNTPELHRVLNMPEYAWIIPEYALLCLNKFEYDWICGNMCEYC